MLYRTFTASLLLLPTLAAMIQADDKDKAAVTAIENLGGSVRKIAANTAIGRFNSTCPPRKSRTRR